MEMCGEIRQEEGQQWASYSSSQATGKTAPRPEQHCPKCPRGCISKEMKDSRCTDQTGWRGPAVSSHKNRQSQDLCCLQYHKRKTGDSSGQWRGSDSQGANIDEVADEPTAANRLRSRCSSKVDPIKHMQGHYYRTREAMQLKR